MALRKGKSGKSMPVDRIVDRIVDRVVAAADRRFAPGNPFGVIGYGASRREMARDIGRST